MDQRFYDAVLASPVIAAVKDPDQLEDCLTLENIRVVFLLFGDVCTIGGMVARAKDAGKVVLVHVDLIAGLSYSANGSEVDTVIINGQITMENRKILTVDEKLVYGKIQDIIVRMGLDKKTY